MVKDIVISILGAMVLSEHPWLQTADKAEKIAIIVGLAIVLFIFLLFLEEMVEKVHRVRKIKQILCELRGSRLKERER